MNSSHILVEIKSRLPAADWPWVLVALRQDALVWSALLESNVGERALAALGERAARAESWAPANLSLLAASLEVPDQASKSYLLQPLDDASQIRSTQVLAAWQQESVFPLSLENCAWLALAVRERYRQNSTWKGLLAEIGLHRVGCSTLLACLYGLLPDPDRLLRALFQYGDGRPRPDLALHTLLCQPLPPARQLEVLRILQSDLTSAQNLALLQALQEHRPWLADTLAADLLQQQVAAHTVAPPSDGGARPSVVSPNGQDVPPATWFAQPFDSLISSLHLAQAYKLAGQPDRAVPLIADALRGVRRLRGHLSAQLAETLAQTRKADPAGSPADPHWDETAQEIGLEAWKQAVQLVPDEPKYAAGLSSSLLAAGQTEEARRQLAQNALDQDSHPALWLSAALLHAHQGEVEDALRCAIQSLRQVEAGQSLSMGEFLSLARLFQAQAALPETLRTVRITLDRYPQDREMLALQARAQFALGQPAAALSSVLAALAVGELEQDCQPERRASAGELRRLMVESLEALGIWRLAWEERMALLEGQEHPSQAELHALIRCADNASTGDPEQLHRVVRACQLTLQFDPQDLLAHRRLAETAQAAGDPALAVEHYTHAVRLAPDQPALWLSLVQEQRAAGQEAQAVEALRAASQAVPNEPQVHLALGESCYTRGELTQALACFRRAAELAPPAPHLALRLGQTLFQLGNLEEAHQVLAPAYVSANQSPSGADPELTYVFARVLLGMGERAQAIPLLTHVVRARPADPEPCLHLARALLQSDENRAGALRAIPFLQRILGLAPDGVDSGYIGPLETQPALRAEARALLAGAYAAAGEWARAMDAYRRALDEPLNRAAGVQTRLATGLGMVALKLDQPEMAVAALQEAAQDEPLNLPVQRSLAEAYQASNLLPEAYQAARDALALAPVDLDTLAWFIDLAWQVLDRPAMSGAPVRQELILALQTAVDLAPDRSAWLSQLGRLHLEQGNAPAALDAFRRWLNGPVGSSQVSDLYQVAQTVRQMGDSALALALLQRAVDLAQAAAGALETGPAASRPALAAAPFTQPPGNLPSLVDLYAELSGAWRQAGDLQAALQAVENALALAGERPALHAEKAALLERLDRPQDALQSLNRALELQPDEPFLRRRVVSLLRSAGQFSEALENARQGLAAAQGEAHVAIRRALSLDAAALAHLTLRPIQALEHLRAASLQDDLALDDLDTLALRAEVALDAGDLALAEPAIDALHTLAPEHPRTLAAQARQPAGRTGALQTQIERRNRRCREAQRNLLRQLNESPEIPPSSREAYIASFLAVSQAALENRLWDDALAILDRLIEIIPETGLAYFKKAQVLILRGEAQRLCQDLDILRHAEGEQALSSQARRSIDECLARAQEWLAVQVDLDPARLQPWEDECRQTLGLYLARGQALFDPSPRLAQMIQSILKVAPPAPDALAALVMAWRYSGDRQRAIQAVEDASTTGLDTHTVHPLVLVQYALARSDPRQAAQDANQALQNAAGLEVNWPPLPALQYLLARLARQANDLGAATQAIHQALAVWPDEPRWQELAAGIYLASDTAGNPPSRARAMHHLEQSISLDPQCASSHLALGMAHLEAGDARQALASLERAAHLEPGNARAWFALAQAQFAVGDLEHAAESADRAIERAAGQDAPPLPAMLLRGQIALQTANPRGALSRAQAILRSQPDHAEALYLLARSLEALDRPADALAVLERTLPHFQADPGRSLAMQLERAHLLRRGRGLESGLAALQELVAHNPGNAGLLALLANWLVEAGQKESAVQAARLALQEDHDQLDDRQRAALHNMVGLHMRQTGQLDQAIYHLNQAVEVLPAQLEPYLELGRTYQDRREYRLALKVYQKAIQFAGGDYRPYYAAAQVLKDSKDYVAAEAMLRRAAQLAPDEVSVHRLLGAVVALNLVHNHRISPTD